MPITRKTALKRMAGLAQIKAIPRTGRKTAETWRLRINDWKARLGELDAGDNIH
jgi:hypothetical protein